jgi:hydrogenase expression/formation protein HypC
MCLGVPGQVVEIQPDPDGMTMGKVRFGGVSREVCLAYVPEIEIGDWVLVHVGFALNRLDEAEAHETLALLAELEEAAIAEATARSKPPSDEGP